MPNQLDLSSHFDTIPACDRQACDDSIIVVELPCLSKAV